MALHSHYEVRWKNFKGFKDTGWVKIKPITILLGTNNSGKTNFTAPFLLMSQTLSSRDSSSPLILKGSLYDGGNIQELMNDYDLRKDIFFGFRYHLHSPKSKLKKAGSYAPGAIEVTLGVNNKKDREIVVKNETIYDIYLRELLKLTRTATGYEITGLDSHKLRTEEKLAIQKSTPSNFLLSPNALLSGAMKEIEKLQDSSAKKRGFSKAFSDLLRAVSFNFNMVKLIATGLSYIGPLREKPHRVYEASNESYNTVGKGGENMPNLLERHYKSFSKELDEWVKRFEFGDKLEFKSLYSNLYSLRFRNEGSDLYTSIPNAGFGASQILPLIVQALVSPKDSLTIAEQPEIHLNPKLQCVLADLFAFMVKKDQRIIVETHSEHLLLRLRTLVANGTLSSKDLAIYFVDRKNGISTINEINIQEDGHVDPNQWPSDFFEDSLRESMALAIAQSKRASKSKTK